MIDLDLTVKRRDPNAPIRVALDDVRCPRGARAVALSVDINFITHKTACAIDLPQSWIVERSLFFEPKMGADMYWRYQKLEALTIEVKQAG